MIIDSLKNSSRYEALNPYFKEAFDYLKSMDFNSAEVGKIILQKNTIIVNINNSVLKLKENAKLEVHDQFIDIQIPLTCPEIFGWKKRETCSDVTNPYNAEKDIAFFGDSPSTYITLQPEEFIIFFPEDAHAPCIGDGEVKKIIVKCAVI